MSSRLIGKTNVLAASGTGGKNRHGVAPVAWPPLAQPLSATLGHVATKNH
jgi:hypothetical protein